MIEMEIIGIQDNDQLIIDTVMIGTRAIGMMIDTRVIGMIIIDTKVIDIMAIRVIDIMLIDIREIDMKARGSRGKGMKVVVYRISIKVEEVSVEVEVFQGEELEPAPMTGYHMIMAVG